MVLAHSLRVQQAACPVCHDAKAKPSIRTHIAGGSFPVALRALGRLTSLETQRRVQITRTRLAMLFVFTLLDTPFRNPSAYMQKRKINYPMRWELTVASKMITEASSS